MPLISLTKFNAVANHTQCHSHCTMLTIYFPLCHGLGFSFHTSFATCCSDSVKSLPISLTQSQGEVSSFPILVLIKLCTRHHSFLFFSTKSKTPAIILPAKIILATLCILFLSVNVKDVKLFNAVLSVTCYMLLFLILFA